MRVAILHDYLNQFGGAERVLEVLLEIFPKADLYTLLYDSKKTFGRFDRNIAKTSILDNSLVRKKHRAFIPLMPFASEHLTSKDQYDLIISSTAGYAKGFNIKGRYHISYCHSPLRYAWEVDYLKNLPFAPWPLKEMIINPIAQWMRQWDIDAAKRVNLFIANSHYIAQKVHSYYGREAFVVFPPVESRTFYPDPLVAQGDYYLMAGRLLYYKGFDIGIKAFNRLKKPLKIVGAGPEAEKLKALVKTPYIEFCSNISDEELRKLYSGAKAFIFPQIEDFGLVAAEAQACGTPVLAYRIGGGGEIVIHKKTGLLFDEQTPEAIEAAVRECEAMQFNRNEIAREAKRFSREQFITKISTIVRAAGFSDTMPSMGTSKIQNRKMRS
ncbi:MAG: glycosyltransferase [Candidatus Paceibacterota bacterium]|jgi:glycosyltransferase involved in cell wall biosynthesis